MNAFGNNCKAVRGGWFGSEGFESYAFQQQSYIASYQILGRRGVVLERMGGKRMDISYYLLLIKT